MSESASIQEQELISNHIHIIHLRESQKCAAKYNPDFPVPFPEDRLEEEVVNGLFEKHIEGDKEATEKLVIELSPIACYMVCRYLYYYPQTRSFDDDMFSEGLFAIYETLSNMESVDEIEGVRPKIVVLAKLKIETLLNDLRFPIQASLRTNHRRIAEGKDPEYVSAMPYVDAKGGKLSYDDGPMYVDLMDELEHLAEIDGEELVDLVFLAMESEQGILEEELTERERELIASLSKIGANCGLTLSRNRSSG